jgi:hypothetical protein
MISRALLLVPLACLAVCVAPAIAQTTSAASSTAGRSSQSRGALAELNAQPAAEPSDSTVLVELFGDAVLSQNAAAACLSARSLPPERRYDRLAEWVLPSPNRHSFRLSGDFCRPSTRAGQAESASGEIPNELRAFPESTWLLSPAIELVEAARQSDQLGKLARHLEATKTTSPSESRARAALLCMVAVARNDVETAKATLDQVFFRQPRHPEAQNHVDQWIDLLVLWSVASNPLTDHLAGAEVVSSAAGLPQYRNDLTSDLINDYLRLLQGRYEDLATRKTAPAEFAGAHESKQFVVFSYVDAATHGLARPLARFRIGRETAYKVSGHETDYLAFRSPLLGDYDVDCEVSTQTGAFTSLMIADTSIEQRNAGRQLRVGSLRKAVRDIDIYPPLEPLGQWTRYNSFVRDGIATYLINGREVDKTSLELSAPWLAFRSWRQAASKIRYVHLNGSPIIPASIDLITSDKLSGWFSYHAADQAEGLGHWRARSTEGGTYELVAPAVSGRIGSYEEDLIRYIRPIFEDGSITYQYLYQPGKTAVHPSVGRLVFLIAPDGIRIHQLTDGLYERTGLRPDNAIAVDTRQESNSLPLIKEGWNQVELQLNKDQLLISINGRLVHLQKVESTDSRIFGLFRYADQTQSVVRNISLSGDWPAALPSTADRELASVQLQRLDQSSADLPAEWIHDFRSGAPPYRFGIHGDPASLIAGTEGIRMQRRENGGAHQVRANLRIDGDFDIVVDYADLEILPAKPTWHSGIGLTVQFDSAKHDELAIYRRADRMAGQHRVAFARKQLNKGGEFVFTGSEQEVDQSTSGRLRLARRGEVIYALHAIGDSSSFRLISSAQISDSPVEIQGVRLIAQSGAGQETKVTWKKIAVRASQLSTPDVDDEQAVIATLNQRRDQLASRVVDFATGDLNAVDFRLLSRSDATSAADDRGFISRVIGEPSSTWTPAGIYGRLGLGAGFDVQADFDVLRLDRPAKVGSSNEAVLQVYFRSGDDPFNTNEAGNAERKIVEASLILRHRGDGTIFLVPRVVGRNRNGGPVYRPIRSVPIKFPSMLRIVYDNQTLYYLYSESGSDEIHLAAVLPIEQTMTAEIVVLSVIATGEGEVAEARWKKLFVAGEEIVPRSNFGAADDEQTSRPKPVEISEP